jgi:hypothetical protein
MSDTIIITSYIEDPLVRSIAARKLRATTYKPTLPPR